MTIKKSELLTKFFVLMISFSMMGCNFFSEKVTCPGFNVEMFGRNFIFSDTIVFKGITQEKVFYLVESQRTMPYSCRTTILKGCSCDNLMYQQFQSEDSIQFTITYFFENTEFAGMSFVEGIENPKIVDFTDSNQYSKSESNTEYFKTINYDKFGNLISFVDSIGNKFTRVW